MAFVRLAILALLGFQAGPVSADCLAGDISGIALSFSSEPPTPPNVDLRPERPDCLRDLSRPEQENCPRNELATYGEEVDEWVASLNDYANATNRYASELARFANSAVKEARRAREFADLALEFRNCEVAAILSPSND